MATSKNIHSPKGRGLSAYQDLQACTRCGGLLIREGLFDLFDDTGQMRRWGRRCVQCGEIVDPLILKHRRGEGLPALNLLSRRRWTGIDVSIKKSMHW